jgi:hypothetical protein
MFVVIMGGKTNTFDNYFGDFPGVNGPTWKYYGHASAGDAPQYMRGIKNGLTMS